MFDFPSGAVNGQQVTGSGGQVYTFDGTKWKATGAATTGTVTNIATGTGLTGGPITTTGTIALSAPVSVANGGTGATTAGAALTSLGAAPLASPTFTGTVTIPAGASISGYAPLASPAFTGTPSLPTGTTGVTQTAGNSSTALATTAFVATSFAPLAAPVFTGDARAVTAAYGDNDTSVSTTAFVQSAVAPTANNVGRNLVTNGTFVVQQRGAGPWTANGNYMADRWQMGFGGGTFSIQVNPASDSIRAQVGDETFQYALSVNVAGGSGAGDFSLVTQAIENVRRLANKTVTVSFYGASGSGTPKIGVGFSQNFGTGGSPSAGVNVNAQAVTLTTTYQRYSVTLAIPSVSGKTLGTNGDDSTSLYLWFSSGATNNTRAGGIGVQSATFGLWGIQLEIGTQATALDAGGTPQQILAECQRFYQSGNFAHLQTGSGTDGVGQTQPFVVQMRAAPTVTPTTTTNLNCAACSALSVIASSWMPYTTITATGAMNLQGTFTASADL